VRSSAAAPLVLALDEIAELLAHVGRVSRRRRRPIQRK
jgi:hypothetical protein